MSLNRPTPQSEKLLDTSRMQEWVGDGHGPIQVSWPPAEYTTAVQQVAQEWGKNLGLQSDNAAIGNSTGYYDQALSVDMESGRRSSAVYEYYLPNAQRTNLILITDAMVQRIVFRDDDSNGDKVATGVEFVVQGHQYSAPAKREVLLCAGTIQSPQILELSGIGSRSILEKHDIKVLVDNAGVGENLQDHVMSGLTYEAVSGVPTMEDLKLPGVMETLIGEYIKSPVGPLVNGITSSVYMSYSDIIDEKSNLQQDVECLIPNSQTLGNTGPAKQMKIHKDRLLNPKDCAVWFIPFAGGTDMRNVRHGSGIFDHSDPEHYLGAAVGLTHALSRGSTHIQSSDVSVHPIIDPRYMSHPADIHVLAQALRVLDAKLMYTEPLASMHKGGKQPTCQEFTPGTSEDFVQNYFSTQWHVLGTCSMLPREDGGVVDPNLKVYGTANLRVIDASVIPLMVQGNIQTAVYAVAEKGADLVKTT